MLEITLFASIVNTPAAPVPSPPVTVPNVCVPATAPEMPFVPIEALTLTLVLRVPAAPAKLFAIEEEASDHPADPLTTLTTSNDSPPCWK